MSNHWLSNIAVLLFDLDGTLYEETSHFDYYAKLLANALSAAKRPAYMADYEAIRDGKHPLRIGLLYDADRDLILRANRSRVAAAWRWDGTALPEEEIARTYPKPVEIDWLHILNVGDLWWAPPAVGRHWGLTGRDHHPAFLQVRRQMMTPEFILNPVPGLRQALEALRPRYRLVMATNSPEEDSSVILHKIGLDQTFDRAYFMANKPQGIPAIVHRITEDFGVPAPAILSVGDNLFNEIIPCRLLGCRAAFLDVHRTRLLETEPDWDLVTDGIRDLIPLLQASRVS